MDNEKRISLPLIDVLEYLAKYDSAEEAYEDTFKASKEFTKDCETLTENIVSLFNNDIVRLSLASVEVTVEVKGIGKQLFCAKIGSTDSADSLHKMIMSKTK